MLQNFIVNVSIHQKPLFLDPYFQNCKNSQASKLFVYLYAQELPLNAYVDVFNGA